MTNPPGSIGNASVSTESMYKGLGIIAITVASLMAVSLFAGFAIATPDNAFSRANTLLFLTNHLDNVRAPSTLHYAFEKRGPMEEEYKDSIDITVSPEKESGGKTAKVRYFTGARNQYIAPISDVQGNPIISMFLQRDVNDMAQRTEGSSIYFQNAIKVALENQAEVKAVTFEYDGRKVNGSQISIVPYRDDPRRAQIEPYADKYYVFLMADAVPGEVYQLRSVVPSGSRQAGQEAPETLLEEVVTLGAVEPLAQKERVE